MQKWINYMDIYYINIGYNTVAKRSLSYDLLSASAWQCDGTWPYWLWDHQHGPGADFLQVPSAA